MTDGNSISKKELIQLKPPATPIQLVGDSERGLKPVTYHSKHGILQKAPQISLEKQMVLQEDQYIEALSHIIKRDFFPCLDQFEKFKNLLSRPTQGSPSLLHSPAHSAQSSSTLTRNYPNLDHPTSSEAYSHPPRTSSLRWEDGGPTPRIPQASSPGMTPLGVTSSFCDTPTSSSNPSRLLDPTVSITPQKSFDPSLSLDQFCSRYTSEDNSSFSEILNNANRLKRIKYSWAFDSSSKHNNRLLESTLKREHLITMIGKMAQGGQGVGLVEGIPGKPGERKMVENVVTREDRLAIEASDQQQSNLMITEAGEKPKSQGTDHDSKTTRPSITASTQVTAIDLATDRHTQSIKNPDSWPHVTRNALMFGPDADMSTHLAPKLPPFPAKPPVLPGGPKSINHASTRMIDDNLLGIKIQKSRATNMSHLSSRYSQSTNSPTRSQIAAAMNPDKSSSTPKVNGFSFVAELPTPNPEHLKSTSGLDQLMTWGEIVSTPLRIDDNDAKDGIEEQEDEELIDRGRFKICKTPRREQLAIGMARKASRSLRQKYGYSSGLGRSDSTKLRKSLLGDSHSPSRSSLNHQHSTPHSQISRTPKRDEILSPAAKVLLNKTCSSAPATKLSASQSSSVHKTSSLNSSFPKKSGIFSPLMSHLKRKHDHA